MVYGDVVEMVRGMMNRVAVKGQGFVHTVFESVEGGQKGFAIYRAHHGAVTTPIVVWVDRMNDEVALGLSYLIEDRKVICESVLIRSNQGLLPR